MCGVVLSESLSLLICGVYAVLQSRIIRVTRSLHRWEIEKALSAYTREPYRSLGTRLAARSMFDYLQAFPAFLIQLASLQKVNPYSFSLVFLE